MERIHFLNVTAYRWESIQHKYIVMAKKLWMKLINEITILSIHLKIDFSTPYIILVAFALYKNLRIILFKHISIDDLTLLNEFVD